MLFGNIPIKRKLNLVIMLTSGAVLLLTCAAFFGYEIVRFRRVTVEKIAILSEIIAANSTAALAFDSPEEAADILGALKAEKYIRSASLYNKKGELFSYYPATIDTSLLPSRPGETGHAFTLSFLEIYLPVIQGNQELGTLYIKYDLDAMYTRFRLYGIIVAAVIIVSGLFAYILSNILQRAISTPILSLTNTAHTVSTNQDYSLRAPRLSNNDEAAVLTDAFNQMLNRIQEQNDALKQSHNQLLKSTAELAKSEEQFRHTLDNMLEGAQIIGFDWKYIYANDALVRHSKYSREELIGYTVMEKYPGIEQAPVFDMYRRCLVGRELIHIENEFQFPDGSVGWFELSFQPIPEGIFILSIDITERKKAEEEIRQLNANLEKKVEDRTAALEAVNKELEAFSYSVSHDLRAPLRAINGFSDMLAMQYKEILDDNAKRLLTVIKGNALTMGQLIDDLLQFSRTGRKEVSLTNADMSSMAFSVINEITQNNADKAKLINIKPLPPAMCDIQLMRQVWANLISNALKYSAKKEKPEIEIGYLQKDNEHIYYVKDNGAGFDMQYSSKLFGVFQRLHSQKEFDGTGVGLALVQRIVNKHGGRVWAEAEVEKGACFYFTLKEVKVPAIVN